MTARLTRTSALSVVGGERISVVSSEPTVVMIGDEPTMVLRCVLPGGSERIVLRSAIVSYEGDVA